MAASKGDDGTVYLAVGGAVLFLCCIFLWNKYYPMIYGKLLVIASYEAFPFASFPGMEKFHSVIARLDPASLTLSDMNSILNRAGRWYAWLIAPFGAWLIWKGAKSSARENYRRKLNMEGLLKNNVKLYPCIAPILNWGNSLLKEKNDSGPWMTARQPIQFVAQTGLLANDETDEIIKAKDLLSEAFIANPDSPVIAGAIKAKFLRSKAETEFKKQFSPQFQGLNKLPPYLYALCAAFLLFGSGKKKEGQKILDNMSISFRPPQKAEKAKWSFKPPFYTAAKREKKGYSISSQVSVPKKELEKLFSSETVQLFVRPHNRYRDHVILALYAYARKKGVIATSEFIWLRPVNRKLFYLLNNYGRRTAWVEIAGPFAHYQAEEILGNHSRDFQGTDIPPEDKLVETAVNALELAMYEEGWVSDLILDKKHYGLMD